MSDETYAEITDDAHPNYRARIVRDSDAQPPEFDAGYPIVRIAHGRGWGGWANTDGQVYGDTSDDQTEALDKFLGYFGWRDGVEVFDRYLRVFRGGKADTLSSTSYRDGADYVVYGTRKLAESWGLKGDDAAKAGSELEFSEWRAYLDGEVYGIVVERSVTWVPLEDHDDDVSMTTWEEVDSCWGFYGDVDGYVLDTAREMLADAVTP